MGLWLVAEVIVFVTLLYMCASNTGMAVQVTESRTKVAD